MATRRKPPPAKAAGDDPPAAAGRDDRTKQALARSREIREKGRPQIQTARKYVATARRRRAGPSVRSLPRAKQDKRAVPDTNREKGLCLGGHAVPLAPACLHAARCAEQDRYPKSANHQTLTELLDVALAMLSGQLAQASGV
jgi:hypothetical protein